MLLRDMSEIPGQDQGVAPVTEHSCAAVWIPVPGAKALDGLTWYNNDGQVVFPEVVVVSGGEGELMDLDDPVLVAADVAGPSSAWGEMTFTEPVASSRGGFYVLFRFPAGSERTADGHGGGAGIGFVDGGGHMGWMTADGKQWVKVGRSYGFAVEPLFVDRQDGMLEKSMEPAVGSLPMAQVLTTELLPAVPNPFNPTTDIRFALKDGGDVRVEIFDVRGRRIVDLVNEVYPSGEHSVTWSGQDRTGSRVASGVYLVRFESQGVQASRRIMLMK